MSKNKYKLMKWPFPAEHLHHGIPLGSGNFGAILWGNGSPLNITLGHMDYWENRKVYEFREGYGFKYLEKCVEKNNKAGLNKIAYCRDGKLENGIYSTRLPVGRITIDLGIGNLTGKLDISRGVAEIASGKARKLQAFFPAADDLLAIRIIGNVRQVKIKAIPAPIDKSSMKKLRSWGYPPPKTFQMHGINFWVQEQPEGGVLGGGYKIVRKGNNETIIFCSVAVRQGREAAMDKVKTAIRQAEICGFGKLLREHCARWNAFWKDRGEIDIPDGDLAQTYYFWLYKHASASQPGKLPVSLQGPWIEDLGLPPWASDYHSNINVQECYWPIYTSNHLEMGEALVDWIRRAMPVWQKYGKALTGQDNTIFVPLSSNNAGENTSFSPGWVSGFLWPGCGPWLGHNLWWHYRYSGNVRLLAELVYPFLKQCFNFYQTFLRRGKNGKLHFSLSGSPEWSDATGKWFQGGRNSSIDLGLMHFLVRALREASETLGRDRDLRPKWRAIDRDLPIAATDKLPDEPHPSEIFIWENEPLRESHRHMSHLISFYPLAFIDIPGRNEYFQMGIDSIKRVWRMGTGLWSGWSFPWASMIMARAGFGNAAYHYLKQWRYSFSNQAYASYHDEPRPTGTSRFMERKELMQLDGGFGACAAVPEMLLQSWWGEIRLFPAVPDCWTKAGFKNLRTEGAFIVSARYENGKILEAQITSTVGGNCRLRNSFGKNNVELHNLATGAKRKLTGTILTFRTKAGERFLLR